MLNASLSESAVRGTNCSAAEKPSAVQPDIPHAEAPPAQQQQPWSQPEADEDAEVTEATTPLCLGRTSGPERCLAGAAENFAGITAAAAFAVCSICAPW